MSYTKARTAGILILTAALSLTAFSPPEDGLELRALSEPPSAEEIAMLEELAQWVGHGDEDDVLSAGSLGQVVRARAASFDVFRNQHAETLGDPLDRLPFGRQIRSAAQRYDVDPLLIASIVEVESSFDSTAVSSKGAVGLMQLMPGNLSEEVRERLTDPEVNLAHGARYLRWLLRLYDGDLELTLAAYNAGPGNVRKFGGLPPFRETRDFVDRVLGLYIGHHRDLWKASEAGQMLASAEEASSLVGDFRG